MTELLVMKMFTLLYKVPSKVSLYGSFSLKIAGLVEYAYSKGNHKFHYLTAEIEEKHAY